MPSEHLLRIHSPKFQAMSERVLRATEFTRGIRIGERTMGSPRVTFITVGHPVDVHERRGWLTGVEPEALVTGPKATVRGNG